MKEGTSMLNNLNTVLSDYIGELHVLQNDAGSILAVVESSLGCKNGPFSHSLRNLLYAASVDFQVCMTLLDFSEVEPIFMFAMDSQLDCCLQKMDERCKKWIDSNDEARELLSEKIDKMSKRCGYDFNR